MKLKHLTKIINLNYDLINIFTDFTFILDSYFNEEKNRVEHKELFKEYQILDKNIKELKRKYKL